ncbi:TIM barrel protein [Gordonia sp. TBRC 11910]|uniref:TIM barrel protein n=1 Tax=Gordonia asplenii TaxID=2725283 RepID=A0A848KYV2_9ACTN|nr:TIM barrel protein [Gordonia asplenii]NMO03559.1 TIM barrel protein [Gordonia asplenii]
MSPTIGGVRVGNAAANLSILYPDRPIGERISAAAAAGFEFVEMWWPFDNPVATTRQINDLVGHLRRAGVTLTAINLDAGDVAAGDRGLLSIPARQDRVRRNLNSVIEIVDRTGCAVVNALYGNRITGLDATIQDETARRNLILVADSLADVGASVVVETLNNVDSPDFPFVDIARTAEFVTEAASLTRHGNIRLLIDVYHLAVMGIGPIAAINSYSDLLGHVQFADHPGRGMPGTGQIDFSAIIATLDAVGYRGHIGFEYHPDYRKESL